MTSETRTLIELNDVTGIEIQCPECQVKILFPIAKGFKLAYTCPQCHKPWFDGVLEKQTGSMVYPAIDNIHAITSNLRMLNRPDRTDIHTKILLKINTEVSLVSDRASSDKD